MDKGCKRCGRKENLEKHHIRLHSEGGSDRKSNLITFCKACHKYKHSQHKLLIAINCTCKFHKKWRKTNLHRLNVLDKLNTPAEIRERGTYRSYWHDDSTHFLIEEQEQIITRGFQTPLFARIYRPATLGK